MFYCQSDFLASSLQARWLLYLQFWSNWVFIGMLFCIPRVLLSKRKSCFRPSSDAVPLMGRTKYIFAPRSYLVANFSTLRFWLAKLKSVEKTHLDTVQLPKKLRTTWYGTWEVRRLNHRAEWLDIINYS